MTAAVTSRSSSSPNPLSSSSMDDDSHVDYDGRLTRRDDSKTSLLSSLASALFSRASSLAPRPRVVVVRARPGLVALLDRALYRVHEGSLTATVCAANALLAVSLELRREGARLSAACLDRVAYDRGGARLGAIESLGRACAGGARDIVDRLVTDRHAIASPDAVGDDDDPWETARDADGVEDDGGGPVRLVCPDFVWADDAARRCARTLRALARQRHAIPPPPSRRDDEDPPHPPPLSEHDEVRDPLEASPVDTVLARDLPVALARFRAAIESDAAVSKRLWAVKCEYRAPVRARAAAAEASLRRRRARRRRNGGPLSQLPRDDAAALTRALVLQRQADACEEAMAAALRPLCEAARLVESRKAVARIGRGRDAPELRRLALALRRACREENDDDDGPSSRQPPRRPESSAAAAFGERRVRLPRNDRLSTHELPRLRLDAILTDWIQKGVAVPDDDDDGDDLSLPPALRENLARFGTLLAALARELTRKRDASDDRDDAPPLRSLLPPRLVARCRAVDVELLTAAYEDWYATCLALRRVRLPDEAAVRRAEEASLPPETDDDRRARTGLFAVLVDVVGDVGRREMNLEIVLREVSDDERTGTRARRDTGAPGIFDTQLYAAGERIPIG